MNTMLTIFTKYFTPKIYPVSYGNRKRSNTEYDRKIIHIDDLKNMENLCQEEEEEENDKHSYKSQLQTTFSEKQKAKRSWSKNSSLRIRGGSF